MIQPLPGRNVQLVPSSVNVLRATHPRLGMVFVPVNQDGEHLCVLLTRDVAEEFIAALRMALDVQGGCA